MAILHQGLFGPITGKISGVVASTWKGINYVREASEKNKKPRTAAQIAVQEKFKFVHQLIKPLSPYFTAGFYHKAKYRTEYNVGYSKNYNEALRGVYPDFVVDYEKITISEGRLDQLEQVVITQMTSQTLEISWEVDYLSRNYAYDDQLMVAILCTEIGLADGFIGGTMRDDAHLTFKFSSKMVGKEIAVYVGLYALNQLQVSDSQFLGKFIAV
ncbi:hypothetical protein IWX76_000572 [Pedobacter sp. CAN_A7]|uniref:DUF6266 family protein n=1 Tax=Pedobacter sp. CAN_A7 TaxID=2787722 RepID=UPI0018C996B0